MQLAALFLLLYSIALTIAPAVRLQSWQGEYRWGHWIGFVTWLIGSAVVHHQLIRWLPDRDPYLFPIGALLSGWGMLAVWRLNIVMGARQTIWLAIALAVIALALRVPDLLNLLRRYKYIWLTGGLLLTAATFLFGVYPGGVGPKLWLGCCGVYLQPSEPLKLLLIAYLSAYLADRLPIRFNLFQILAPSLILIGAALSLLVGQRDLGTASLFILIYTVVVYIASHKKRVLLISLGMLLAAGVTGYLLFDVVRIRVDAWLNPWLDPAGRSYQIIQSLLAVASGGILGRGPGLGSPGVVPVSHSDFIFASLAEEHGLAGAVAVLALYALLVGRGIRAALFAANNYRRYLAVGITAYLAIQAIFIVGGNLRLLPLTGVTLPFLSYGGSSLLTAYISLMLLLIVSNQEVEGAAPLRNPGPYILSGSLLLSGLAALALVAGWWAVVRAPGLVARPENPRRVITERYVPRGALLDRNEKPISTTTGAAGEYTRLYHYPQLSGAAGYNSPLYGQSGLEAGLDDILRGLEGNPESLVFTRELLYGQPPPGLDVRLSIDLAVQEQADALMEGRRGALVLLDAGSGEILAMASHPNFDPNRLEEIWLDLLQDPNAPLLNRATQGLYPPGPALGPFLLAYAARDGSLPPRPSGLDYTAEGERWTCAEQPQPPLSIGKVIAGGCPAPLAAIGAEMGADALAGLFESLGFYTAPALPLQAAPPSTPGIDRVELAAIGQEDLAVTPLQMALAAAALSNDGAQPSPALALAMRTPDNGWTPLPHEPGRETLLAGGARLATRALAQDDAPYWQAAAVARSGEEEITWFLGGSLLDGQGPRLALALVLEENNPALAREIGQALLDSLVR